jgi:AcrR family transcriptional regulator
VPRAGLTPGSVAEAAARFADESGYEGMSLSAVAKRCGVAVPSLYKHVDGLDGLRAAVAALGAGELGAAIGLAAQGRSGAEAVRSVAAAYRAYAHAHPGRYAALQRASDPGRASVDDQGGAVAVLAAVLRGFGLPEPSLVDAIRSLRSALHGFVDLEARGGFRMREDVDASFAALVEAFVRSLRDWPDRVSDDERGGA